MRHKFFFISFLALFTTTVSVSAIMLHYFQSERMTFLDAQIRQAATAIIDSKLYSLKPSNFRRADEIISEELGPDSVGKFFIMRNDQGEIIYQSHNIQSLPEEIPTTPQWVTITTKDFLIRAVNLDLPAISTRKMQVGVVVDASFMSLGNVHERTLGIIGKLFIMILFSTWLLSSYLFSPIKTLARYLNEMTKSFETDSELPPLPKKFDAHSSHDPLATSDEFKSLIGVLKSMVDKINSNRRFMRSWSFQMAHELKTPLTILNRDFEDITQKHKIDDNTTRSIESTIKRISATVSGFLGWAEMITLKKVDNLYVVRFSEILNPLLQNWEKIYGSRLVLEKKQDFQLLCNPLHLEQLVDNILSNALKYSQDKVYISFHNLELEIRDEGPGIPDEVLQRVGSPFNKGVDVDSKMGVGLGLAWVQTICNLYRWELKFSSTEKGADVRVKFKPIISD